jgi:hypothetical protein
MLTDSQTLKINLTIVGGTETSLKCFDRFDFVIKYFLRHVQYIVLFKQHINAVNNVGYCWVERGKIVFGQARAFGLLSQ